MPIKKMYSAFSLILLTSLASCAVANDHIEAKQKLIVKISPDDPSNPKRIRFDVDSTPYASQQDPRLTMNERIRLGMRRLAAEQLAERGYCPHGFNGPDLVLGRKMAGASFFFVDCLPPTAKK